MQLQIVNPEPRYVPVGVTEPLTHGFVHVAATVQPNPVPRIQRREPTKAELIDTVKQHAHPLEQLEIVHRVTLFDAIAMPPIDLLGGYLAEHAESIRPARFDVVVLVETTSPSTARLLKSAPEFAAIQAALDGAATSMHVIAARATRWMGHVDRSRDGLFLFNYFVAEDADVMLRLWDYLAAWYAVETGLDNSALLTPLEDEASDYVAINNARWDLSLPGYLARHLSKKTFRSYVQANLEANRVGAMPVLYRLA
jgi:hypothetical protein